MNYQDIFLGQILHFRKNILEIYLTLLLDLKIEMLILNFHKDSVYSIKHNQDIYNSSKI